MIKSSTFKGSKDVRRPMVNVNLEYMPPQTGYIIDLDEVDGFSVKSNDEDEAKDNTELAEPSFTTRAFGSNDIHITYMEWEPGEGIPWHTHSQEMYQIYVVLQGTFKVSFIDADDKMHSTEVSGEDNVLVYLPPGAHNQVESTEEKTLKFLSIKKETRVTRADYLLEDPGDVYDPWSDPEYGLEIDTMRGKVLKVQDSAVTEY